MRTDKEQLRQELDELGAKTLQQARPQELSTPSGYFEAMEEALFQRLKTETRENLPTQRTFWRWQVKGSFWPLAAAAAAVLLLMWLGWSVNAPARSPELELTAEDIASYLRENPDLICPEALSTALPYDTWQNADPDWELFLRDLSPEEIDHLNL